MPSSFSFPPDQPRSGFVPTLKRPSEALRRVAFFGRRLVDYEAFFGFTTDSLGGKRVLDIGAGSASFTAEASRRGVEAVAIDPVYRLRFPAVRDRVERDFRAMRQFVDCHRERFALETAEAEEALWADRAEARNRFLADYRAGAAAGRYRAGGLPRLDLPDKSFHRVLCGHLLFLYAARFSGEFHLRALLEMVRLAREQVTLYPLATLDGGRYAAIEDLRRELGKRGIESIIEPVHHVILRGGNERLVLYPGI